MDMLEAAMQCDYGYCGNTVRNKQYEDYWMWGNHYAWLDAIIEAEENAIIAKEAR